MRRALWLLGTSLSLSLFVPQAGAISLFQLQTFDDPAHGWVTGAGPMIGTPTLVPTALGGPAGPADPFLSITATGGSGPGSRLSVQNFDQWAGDYLGSSVSLVRMDVMNFGPQDLFLRLLFVEFGAMGPVGFSFSTDPIHVLAQSGWQTIAFDVTPGALTTPLGSTLSVLSNAGELRLFHNQAPFFEPGSNPPVTATLGVDNISAGQVVPEPATLSLLLAGLALGGIGRSRSRRGRRARGGTSVRPR
jgi:hypothetical protein